MQGKQQHQVRGWRWRAWRGPASSRRWRARRGLASCSVEGRHRWGSWKQQAKEGEGDKGADVGAGTGAAAAGRGYSRPLASYWVLCGAGDGNTRFVFSSPLRPAAPRDTTVTLLPGQPLRALAASE